MLSLHQIVRYLVLGVVGLLISLSYNLFQNSIEETGERYYRIPLLGNEFRGKQARQAATIVIPLIGFILMGILQPQLVGLALDDWRVLSTLFGLLVLMVLISSNADPENWNLYDGRPLTHYAITASLLLMIGPWVGPWLITVTTQFLSRQYSRLTSFVVTQIDNIITFVAEWLATHTPQITLVLLLSGLGYAVLKRTSN